MAADAAETIQGQTMSMAFIVLAHRAPKQLARLVDRLAPHQVYVHIDRTVADNDYHHFEAALTGRSNVHFVKRCNSAWASWGIVEASLIGLRAALQGGDWGHVFLISGQHYPLTKPSEMERFLCAHKNHSFLPHFKLPHPVWGKDGGMHRVNYWHHPIKGRRFFIPIKRSQPANLPPYGGSMFWTLSRDAAEHLIEFTDNNPKIVDFFKNVWIPDELYVSTVLLNSPLHDSIINENLTYIRWSQPGAPHPDQLSEVDLQELVHAAKGPSEKGGKARLKLFCRKVDEALTQQKNLMDALDRHTGLQT